MIRAAENSDSDTEDVFVGGFDEIAFGDEIARRNLSSYGSVTVAVIDALEAADATPPDPDWVLDDVVDTDSIEQMFAPKTSGEPRVGGLLVFDAWGVTVAITRTAVSVFSADDSGGPAVDDPSP